MKNYVAPGGMHVRVDSGLYTGYRVPPYYDSMIGKLIVYGCDRERCIRRLKRALEEFVVEGMKTTIPLHQQLVRDEEFLAGDYTIKWLEQWLAKNAGSTRRRSMRREMPLRRCRWWSAAACRHQRPWPDISNGPQPSEFRMSPTRISRFGRAHLHWARRWKAAGRISWRASAGAVGQHRDPGCDRQEQQ